MGVQKGVDYTSDEIIKEIYDCAMNVLGHGIAVPSNNHPCGWDWIDFEYIDGDILEYKFNPNQISNGNYEDSEYDWLTLKEILIKANGKFLFEINCSIDWEGGC